MAILKWFGWLALSICAAIGLAYYASRISENEIISFLLGFAGGFIAFTSTWGARSNLHRCASEMSKDAGVWFFWSIFGIGLFISMLANDPLTERFFLGFTFATAWLGPLSISQAKIIREFHYDPLSDPENHY